MGNDGGDIPGRKELVKQKQKTQAANPETIAISRARFCNMTNEPFKQPLAICRMGYLYNFEQILKALVQKQLPSKYAYIRKLTDIKQIKIQRTTGESLNYIACPITNLQYNGFNKFVAIWKCGHVVSRKAFKEIRVKGQLSKCVICQEQYESKDIIDLNLQGQQAKLMHEKLLKKALKKLEKKSQDTQQIKTTEHNNKKTDAHINSMDRLSGQFRDVIRQRDRFKTLFHKHEQRN